MGHETKYLCLAARNANDIAAAVNFARENNLRLVVKGGGHSYQCTSNASDSLLIWTRHMHDVTIQHEFVPQGCKSTQCSSAGCHCWRRNKLTLRVRDLPEFAGGAIFTIKASSDDAYRRLMLVSTAKRPSTIIGANKRIYR